MPGFDIRDLVLPGELAEKFAQQELANWWPGRPTVRILVVVDGSVSVTNSLGVGKAVELIRANVDPFVSFVVDIADVGEHGSALQVVDPPGAQKLKYKNFRFSSQHNGKYVIEGYDQIWCFSWAPGNIGGSDDKEIWDDPHATNNGDLSVLTHWMNAGGGMLAMGDHHYLGASICARIPRVGTMRRWTNAQHVPTIGGSTRLDTNRPQNALQDPDFTNPPQVIPIGAQEDGVPQRIEWKRYDVYSPIWFRRRQRPHPLLCGQGLGVIDVLPDHPHEGWIFEDTEINLNATHNYLAGGYTPEYPDPPAGRRGPEVIAWGNTLAAPRYRHYKDEGLDVKMPPRRFGVIGVYDGDPANVGRVVVDSTWHHWFDLNIDELDAESPDAEFQKIARYFRNCAVWLSRPHQRQRMLTYTAFVSVFHASGFEDLRRTENIFTLGGLAIDVIGRLTSDCLAHSWLDVFIDPGLIYKFKKPENLDFPIWAEPPADLARQAVLGGIIREMAAIRDEILSSPLEKTLKAGSLTERVDDATLRGAKAGLAAFQEAARSNMSQLNETLTKANFELREMQPRKEVPPTAP